MVDHSGMVINMNTTKLRTIDQVREFLQGSTPVEFYGRGNDDERYAHISQVLKQFDYNNCPLKQRFRSV